MRNIWRQLLAVFVVMFPMVLNATEVPDESLVGIWVQPPWTNGMPQPETIKWLSLTFHTNTVVQWEWTNIRNGITDSHSGIIGKIEKSTVTQSGQEYQRIRIFPDRSDLLDVVMESVCVDIDNRFPRDWRILKFKCGEDNSVVLVRKEDVIHTNGPAVLTTSPIDADASNE